MHDGHAQRWTRDQKSKPEVNSRSVIKWKKHKFVDLSDYNIFEPNLVQSSNTTLSTRRNGQIHITWNSKMAAAAVMDF